MNTIVLGVASQTLVHSLIGSVASATYLLENLRYGDGEAARTIASGSATLGGWSLTSSAAAGSTTIAPAKFPTASTTGATIGAAVVVTGLDGSTELGEIAAVSANSYVELAAPLVGTYATGSTLAPASISCPVPDVFAADESAFELEPILRITWVYTLGGVVRRVGERVGFERHDSAISSVAAEALLEVKALYPDLAERMPDGVSLERVVPILCRHVDNDLRTRQIEPARFFVGSRGVSLVAAKIMVYASRSGYQPGRSPLAEFQASCLAGYIAELANLVVGAGDPTSFETTKTDAAEKPPYRGVTYGF